MSILTWCSLGFILIISLTVLIWFLVEWTLEQLDDPDNPYF